MKASGFFKYCLFWQPWLSWGKSLTPLLISYKTPCGNVGSIIFTLDIYWLQRFVCLPCVKFTYRFHLICVVFVYRACLFSKYINFPLLKTFLLIGHIVNFIRASQWTWKKQTWIDKWFFQCNDYGSIATLVVPPTLKILSTLVNNYNIFMILDIIICELFKYPFTCYSTPKQWFDFNFMLSH
jgi:hypothetical protein